MVSSAFQSNRISSKRNGHWDTATVFLPGWGFDGKIINLTQPSLPWIYPPAPLRPDTQVEELLSFLDEKEIGRIRLIGWSMGALQALNFAGAHPERIASLHLISMRQKWPIEEIDQIRAELRQDLEKCLTLFYRKCFLGHKEAYNQFTSTLQPEYLRQANLDFLNAGLTYLQKSRPHPASGVTTYLIHGRNDIIVPWKQMARLARANIEIVEQAGHLPFLSPACSLQKSQKKETIRRKFSRAAATYDQHAHVQKKTAGILAAMLTAERSDRRVGKILEIGCGTGNYTRHLTDIFPQAQITALDFSQEMINNASLKLINHQRINFVCDDAEHYLAQAGLEENIFFDLITSNATLQWFTDLGQSLNHISKLLRPGGILLCSFFGPRTLEELSQGLSCIFDKTVDLAAADFPGKERIRQKAADFFPSAVIKEKLIEKRYSSLKELLYQIKKTGTVGGRGALPLVFTSDRLDRLGLWFEKRTKGLVVTYQIFFLLGKK